MSLCCCASPDRVEDLGPSQQRGKNRRGVKDVEGVSDERGCTDIVFLGIFLAVLAGLGYGIYYAVVRGDDARIIFGYDVDGDICGRSNKVLFNISASGKNTINTPFLDINSFSIGDHGLATVGHCVGACSNEKFEILRRCLPLKAAEQATNWFLTSSGLSDFLNQFAMDFQLCWKEVVYLCLIALGLSLVLTILFRFLAGVLIWIMLVCLVLGSFGGTGFLWWVWYTKKNTSAESSTLAYAILASVGAILIFLIVLVMRKRVELVAALFREAGKAIHAMPLLLIQPIYTLIALVVLCAGFLYGAVWIESAGTATIENGNQSVFFKKDTFLQVTRWYNIFVALWISQLCLACQNYIIAGAVASWYFTREKSRLGCPIAKSTGHAVRYHLGSLAFGSLLIAIMKFIRLLFNYMERKLRNTNSCFGLATCLRCFCKCCLYCFEKFLQGLCTNAYIEIAIYGENFCWSAGRAFKMIANNVLRIAAINSVGDFILFLGKAAVVTATVLIGIELIKDKPGVVYMWTPIFIAAVFAFLISHSFISVYEMCIDSIFICFCEDCEMNDGLENPYYMSRSLMEFVENSKKALRARVGRNRNKRPEAQAYDNQGINMNDEGPSQERYIRPTAPNIKR